MSQHKVLNQYEKHKKILKEFTFNQFHERSYKPKKISRAIVYKIDDHIFLPQLQNEVVSCTASSIYPEFMEYCYSLEGCPKKLIYYLVFHQVNVFNCEFIFNAQTIHEFMCYDGIMKNNGKCYSSRVVKSARQKLVTHNIIQNIKRGRYMINPMIMGGTCSSDRRRLINVYSGILRKNGKNASTRFYPIK